VSPRWLFFPTPVSGTVLSFTGTLTAASSGPGTNTTNMTATPLLPTGISSIQTRSDGFRLGFIFNNSTNRDAFVSAYPPGSHLWTLTIDGDVGVSSSSWSYNTGIASNRAYVQSFDSWPSNYLYTVGDSVTLTLE